MMEKMRTLKRTDDGSWAMAAAFAAIALVTILVLVVLLKKTDSTHLTIGAALVMLIYLTIGGFMVLAAHMFTSRTSDDEQAGKESGAS